MHTIETLKCGKCGRALVRRQDGQNIEYDVCLTCGTGQRAPTPAKSIQMKLPIDPGKPTTRTRVLEETVQRGIINALLSLGYIVSQTTVRYKFQHCPRCSHGFRPTGGYGASKAVPDLLIRNPAWPPALWLGIEVKGTETRLSEEQKAAQKAGHIVIARSVEDALMHVRQVENSFFIS